mmetsp:Transcript_23937/g.35029  ORF Transcript_23937/g.35029 Transcript_23937/m.35029 type:complete len:143 (-) Transcript_23937:214-642(-)|eukprot:CAMPEP_0195516928 /NCGR_PEP_ID=MMETSP0794_2-20130614/9183_1 /TAXON_ID=515487 /ORGANISM="Stephanopyxis turris, Strain CCMP 815" /LENGTH=142 /DNA_ID=CAMNT_0040645645 /DNA_START=137 /DNA_END=565 /DNA_ORIENTATION=-
MGLLKHVTLPLLALLHSFVAFTAIVGDRGSLPSIFDWPVPLDNEDSSLYVKHAFGIIGGFHAAFAFATIVGVLHEDAHFRAILATMELIIWGNGGLDAMFMGFPCAFAYVASGLAAVSLVIHMMEPGIFTKDKGDDADKKKD